MKPARPVSTVCVPIAGRGKRLGETGRQIPKCLLEIGGETLLDYAISLMKRSGMARFVFILGYLKEQVVSHLERRHSSLDAVIVEQAEAKGIVHAVGCAREQLEGEPFAIYCPDNYFADFYDLHRCIHLWNPEVAAAVIARYREECRRNRGCFHAPFDRRPGQAVNVERIVPSDAAGWISTGFSVEGPDYFRHADRIAPRNGERRLFDVWRSALESGGTIVATPLEGRLFDVSSEPDADALRDALASPAEGVAVILRAPDDRLLLMQRDKKAGIRYPGYWALFGGSVDPGETPREAACRELEEELELRIDPGGLRRVTHYFSNLKREHVYEAALEQSIESLTLREGRAMRLFDASQLAELEIRGDDRQALMTYLQQEGLL